MPENAKTPVTLRESLIARGFIVLEGREQDFVTLESMLFSAHHPLGDLQLLIFKRILEATWNLQRCREAEIALWQSTGNATLDPLLDDANQHRYERIAKYARQNQINLRRAADDLRAIQRRDKDALIEAQRLEAARLPEIPPIGHNFAIKSLKHAPPRPPATPRPAPADPTAPHEPEETPYA